MTLEHRCHDTGWLWDDTHEDLAEHGKRPRYQVGREWRVKGAMPQEGMVRIPQEDSIVNEGAGEEEEVDKA